MSVHEGSAVRFLASKGRVVVAALMLTSALAVVNAPLARGDVPACSPTSSSTSDGITTLTFATGDCVWTVPDDPELSSIRFEVYGAQGGGNAAGDCTGANGLGGKGGKAVTTVSVTGDETFEFTVGGMGANSCGTGGGDGSSPGGGYGGSSSATPGGGGGGGYSDVRSEGNQIAVGGGGGGSGGTSCLLGDPGCETAGHGAGGDGGGTTGAPGQAGAAITTPVGGGGGTQGGPGSGGAYGFTGAGDGAGEDGAGSAGGPGGGAYYSGGGGGGGGYYGGGGGGSGYRGAGGGGGSSYGDSVDAGVRTGDGLIVVIYQSDFVAPTSTISFPADGAAYTDATFDAGCTTSGFCGTSADTGVAVQEVELSILDVATGKYWNATTQEFDADNETFVEATGTEDWSYAFAASSFPADGSYTVHAHATDELGNVEASPTATFTIDNVAPTSTISFPVDTAGYGTASFNAGCTTPGFCGTSADTDAGVQKVELSILDVATGKYWSGTAFDAESETFVEATGTAAWSYAFPASSFPTDGSYTVHARATDDSGNVEASPTATFTIDPTGPGVACAALPPTFVWGGPGGDVSATVTDSGSGPAATSVSAAANVSSVGRKSVLLTGYDNAGNSTSQSCAYVVQYNVLGYTLGGTSVRHGGTIKFTFQLANASSVVLSKAAAQALLQTPCSVRARLDSGTTVCATYLASKQRFQVSIKTSRNIALGPHTVTLEILSGADVINSIPATVTIT